MTSREDLATSLAMAGISQHDLQERKFFFWLNSVEVFSRKCLLASTWTDLADGAIICELVDALLAEPGLTTSSPFGKRAIQDTSKRRKEMLHDALQEFEAIGLWRAPEGLQAVANSIARGDETVLAELCECLRYAFNILQQQQASPVVS
eukprot:957879-Pyramimonas_sp.AAC.1